MSAVQLAKLLQNCCVCESECHTVVNGGTMISTSFMCPKGNSSILESQKAILECHGQICWLPVLLCLVETMPRKASESFKPEDDVHVHIHQPAGNLWCTCLFFHTCMRLPSTDPYCGVLGRTSDPLTRGEDARCDSSVFIAKFGSYTLMELSSGKILDFQLVQVITM